MSETDCLTAAADIAAAMKTEIAADIARGTVPDNLTDFGDLQRHVDANTYGTAKFDEYAPGGPDVELIHATTALIDSWLLAGCLTPLAWRKAAAGAFTADTLDGLRITTQPRGQDWGVVIERVLADGTGGDEPIIDDLTASFAQTQATAERFVAAHPGREEADIDVQIRWRTVYQELLRR